MAIGRFSKKASDHIPLYEDQGLDYLVGTTDDNKVMISGTVALVAGSATVELPEMADTNYQVLATSDGSAVSTGSKTVSSFALSGTGTDSIDYLVVGKLAKQA